MTTEIVLSDDVIGKIRQFAERADMLDDGTVEGVIEHLVDETGMTDEAVEAERSRVVDDYEPGSSSDATLAERQSSEARLSSSEAAKVERERKRLREKHID